MNSINPIVPMEQRHIVPIGGSMSPAAPVLFKFVIGLAERRKTNQRVLVLTTATGDDPSGLVFYYQHLSRLGCQIEHLGFFSRTPQDLRTLMLSQDVIFVGGGNTKSMLAVWREYGVDKLIKEAWERGTVLAGSSAGGVCWFESCLTDSYAVDYTPLPCLGILKGSCCPHYDSGGKGEDGRKATYFSMVKSGKLAQGYAINECAALHFVGQELTEVLSGTPIAGAFRITLQDGEVLEEKLEARFLGE